MCIICNRRTNLSKKDLTFFIVTSYNKGLLLCCHLPIHFGDLGKMVTAISVAEITNFKKVNLKFKLLML